MPTSTPRQHAEAILRNVPKKTGKSLAEWKKLIKKAKPSDAKAAQKWLIENHGLGADTARFIAEHALGVDSMSIYEDSDALLQELFSGSRAPLRPIYDSVIKAIGKLGDDVEILPRKTSVTVGRKRKIVSIIPRPKSGLVVGFSLGDAKVRGKIGEAVVMKNDCRITHEVVLTKKSEVDSDFRKWLKAAYEADG